jgi:hypothetical protein
MAIEFGFLRPEDRPALVAVSTPEHRDAAEMVLGELGYVVHPVESHEEFGAQFSQVQYHLVLLEELFACSAPDQNISLVSLQWMPMSQRRHATIVLLGDRYQTLNSMQAYQQSVHAVVHPDDMPSLNPVVQKAVSENNLFYHTYRAAQIRVAEGIN